MAAEAAVALEAATGATGETQPEPFTEWLCSAEAGGRTGRHQRQHCALAHLATAAASSATDRSKRQVWEAGDEEARLVNRPCCPSSPNLAKTTAPDVVSRLHGDRCSHEVPKVRGGPRAPCTTAGDKAAACGPRPRRRTAEFSLLQCSAVAQQCIPSNLQQVQAPAGHLFYARV